MSISVYGKAAAPLKSTHGKILLQELTDAATADLSVVQSCLEQDKLAGRLRGQGGDNAYHVLLRRASKYPTPGFVMSCLQLLFAHSPEGVGARNDEHLTPLHVALMQPVLHRDAVSFLVASHPLSCSLPAKSDGSLPLHLYLKREANDAEAEQCKAMCKAFPDGPRTPDSLGNLPLHYFVRNCRPCRLILALLLRRHPEAASSLSHWGSFPLHLLCAVSDDLGAIQQLAEVYPEALKTPDRHGRTCLHLAALSVGREHQEELRRREDQREAERRAGQEKEAGGGKGDKGDKGGGGEEDGEEDEGWEEDEGGGESQLEERGKSREHVRWIIAQWPEALCRVNNFQATPVETVLEKTKPTTNKHKNVLVFGLFDDPPTARILLLAQRHWGAVAGGLGAGVVPLRPRYLKPLGELNWLARRVALLVSLQGEPRPLKVGASRTNPWGSGSTAGGKKDAILKTQISHAAKKAATDKAAGKAPKGLLPVAANNVLARLRREGHGECVQLIVAWL